MSSPSYTLIPPRLPPTHTGKLEINNVGLRPVGYDILVVQPSWSRFPFVKCIGRRPFLPTSVGSRMTQHVRSTEPSQRGDIFPTVRPVCSTEKSLLFPRRKHTMFSYLCFCSTGILQNAPRNYRPTDIARQLQ